MLCLLLLLFSLVGQIVSAANFVPISHGDENWEKHTGLWVCPKLGEASDVLPLSTRLYATRQSVTDGVALRIDISKGSKGTITMENSPFQPDTAGLTFYAKASSPLEVMVANRAKVNVTSQWQKFDISWEKLGTEKARPSVGWEFQIELASPAKKNCYLIIDRLGTESPTFDPDPNIKKQQGLDVTINTKDILGNASVLAPTIERLKKKQPFRIIAFGDSVTAGAQCNRGNWGIEKADHVQFLYFGHLATLLETEYGYKGIDAVQNGYGGWTAEQGRKIVEKVFQDVRPEDVIIIEFGGNDLGWAKRTIDQWLISLEALVNSAKKKTSQIIIMSMTTGPNIPPISDNISRRFRVFADKQKVAFVDVTRWSMYRGQKYAWAYLANGYHPDFMGHIMMGEIMSPLFTEKHFDWPPYVRNPKP
ncbi:MAG: SGNH/GDSL hydrolase family protein [Planctomycetota bacterium]